MKILLHYSSLLLLFFFHVLVYGMEIKYSELYKLQRKQERLRRTGAIDTYRPFKNNYPRYILDDQMEDQRSHSTSKHSAGKEQSPIFNSKLYLKFSTIESYDKQIAQNFFNLSSNALETTHVLLLSNKINLLPHALVQLHQTLENALKAYLYYQEKVTPVSQNLKKLFKSASAYDEDFANLLGIKKECYQEFRILFNYPGLFYLLKNAESPEISMVIPSHAVKEIYSLVDFLHTFIGQKIEELQ